MGNRLREVAAHAQERAQIVMGLSEFRIDGHRPLQRVNGFIKATRLG